jgi:hypothetical protein
MKECTGARPENACAKLFGGLLVIEQLSRFALTAS